MQLVPSSAQYNIGHVISVISDSDNHLGHFTTHGARRLKCYK
jgi:hypothetical protein